jgi:hypothetical protein
MTPSEQRRDLLVSVSILKQQFDYRAISADSCETAFVESCDFQKVVAHLMSGQYFAAEKADQRRGTTISFANSGERIA